MVIWILFTAAFCLVKKGNGATGEKFCLAAKYHLLPASVQQLPPTIRQGNSSLTLYLSQQQLFAAFSAFAEVTARLSVLGAAVVPSSFTMKQLPGSLQQVLEEHFQQQLLPDGEVSCFPVMWR